MDKKWLVLPQLAGGADLALLLARLVVGAFLIFGVWDNIVSAERLAEFEKFLTIKGFVMPGLMAPLSVYAQFLVGVAFIAGFATRWAGLICAFNFVVALVMVDAPLGIRPAFPATALVLFGLIFATIGAGGFALDAMLSKGAPSDKGWRE
ncbi:DoxX family protein [Sphingomonas sp. BT-65]|uniref:DoxX family protein n=1 Tax=Sphingomonas sp. BT-65 TaxID=2989821 RepID=UPI0022359EA0|nr:DoxX family protein [Sphingomonas sp. BT-65]MCW4461252.1 DoxX family protein [Sphingomonas sp. BT-65]